MWPVVNIKRSEFDVYIGRPSKWGNIYRAGIDGPRDEVILMHEVYLQGRPDLIKQARRELRGKILGCYCYPLSCHGNVLARIANDWQLARPLDLGDLI